MIARSIPQMRQYVDASLHFKLFVRQRERRLRRRQRGYLQFVIRHFRQVGETIHFVDAELTGPVITDTQHADVFAVEKQRHAGVEDSIVSEGAVADALVLASIAYHADFAVQHRVVTVGILMKSFEAVETPNAFEPRQFLADDVDAGHRHIENPPGQPGDPVEALLGRGTEQSDFVNGGEPSAFVRRVGCGRHGYSIDIRVQVIHSPDEKRIGPDTGSTERERLESTLAGTPASVHLPWRALAEHGGEGFYPTHRCGRREGGVTSRPQKKGGDLTLSNIYVFFAVR